MTSFAAFLLLKLLKKKSLKEPKHIQHVLDEKDVLLRVPTHPNLLRLRETLSDDYHLYFTMVSRVPIVLGCSTNAILDDQC